MFAFTCISYKEPKYFNQYKTNRNEKNRSNINKSSPELK